MTAHTPAEYRKQVVDCGQQRSEGATLNLVMEEEQAKCPL